MEMKYEYTDLVDAAALFSDRLEFLQNNPSYEFLQRRMDFLDEEVEELRQAIVTKDDVEIVDGAMDVMFIALTQAYQLFRLKGYSHHQAVWKVRAAFLEVCRSNLDKNPPEKKGAKITKPEGWRPPRIADLLRHKGPGFMSAGDAARQEADNG